MKKWTEIPFVGLIAGQICIVTAAFGFPVPLAMAFLGGGARMAVCDNAFFVQPSHSEPVRTNCSQRNLETTGLECLRISGAAYCRFLVHITFIQAKRVVLCSHHVLDGLCCGSR